MLNEVGYAIFMGFAIAIIFLAGVFVSNTSEEAYKKAYDEGYEAAIADVTKEYFDSKYTATRVGKAIILVPNREGDE